MYTTSVKHVPPSPPEPLQVSLPLWGQALLLVIGAALGIYFYYKRISRKNQNGTL